MTGGVGVRPDARLALPLAAVRAGHVADDRLFASGLTVERDFRDAHLPTRSAPVAVPADEGRPSRRADTALTVTAVRLCQ